MGAVTKKINDFYNEQVILAGEKVQEIRDKKRNNIERLREGINKHNESHGTNYILYDSVEQGSIAMSTAINPEYDDFDIDVGIVFEKSNIPNQTEEAKDLIIKFLEPYNYLFKRNPTKKKNCIRIEYQEAYHVDFAIYRIEDENYEHCGERWTERNPRSINRWFYEKNQLYNNRLREITRFIKYFAKTRKEWDICGGLIITVLVEELLNLEEIDLEIDSILVNIINRLIERINSSQSVLNPVNGQELITTTEHLEKLNNLKEKLSMFVEGLNNAYLEDNDSLKNKIWNRFFNTEYFELETEDSGNVCEDNEMFIENIYSFSVIPVKLQIKCQRYISKDNFDKSTVINCNDNEPFSLKINKNEKLCFSVETNLPKPYKILWKIKNNGKKAIEKNCLRGELHYGNELKNNKDNIHSELRYEQINFEGNHYVECYLIKDNICIAARRFNVVIVK